MFWMVVVLVGSCRGWVVVVVLLVVGWLLGLLMGVGLVYWYIRLVGVGHGFG